MNTEFITSFTQLVRNSAEWKQIVKNHSWDLKKESEALGEFALAYWCNCNGIAIPAGYNEFWGTIFNK